MSDFEDMAVDVPRFAPEPDVLQDLSEPYLGAARTLLRVEAQRPWLSTWQVMETAAEWGPHSPATVCWAFWWLRSANLIDLREPEPHTDHTDNHYDSFAGPPYNEVFCCCASQPQLAQERRYLPGTEPDVTGGWGSCADCGKRFGSYWDGVAHGDM